MTLLPQTQSNINKCCQEATNINTYQQISININKCHEVPTNINNYHHISTTINKYQQMTEPEVCLWPSRDQIHHICYAQTTNISMTLLPQAPLTINTFLTSSNKYQHISTKIN